MFHLYGFMIGVGVTVGIMVAQLQAKRFKIPSSLIENSLIWILIPAICGARLYHVTTDWQLYVDGPWMNVFKIWNGGLGFFGALIGGIIGLILYVWKQSEKRTRTKVSPPTTLFTLLDLLAFGAPVAQAIGRFGNYFNQELYGLLTTVPWAIEINGQRYHPLFAYEAILNLFVFGLLNWLGWKKKLVLGKGQYACIYLACYGLIRFWLEFLRPETARWTGVLGVFSIAQWVALSTTMLTLVIFWLRRHADRGINWELKTLL
jgi:prolipoprotein diacylglyceryl transferase